MSVLEHLDWSAVRAHYDQRISIHHRLLKLHDGGLLDAFARLLLGVSDPAGNYSASEHGLGPKILGSNGPNVQTRLASLATAFRALTKPRDVPTLIRTASLKYLWIAVGSEASCLLNPQACWVANTRTIWTHLVIKHGDNLATADEALRLYRDDDATSEMAYRAWQAIHTLLEVALTRIAEQGADLAREDGVVPGDVTFLWADAIASQLYQDHHP